MKGLLLLCTLCLGCAVNFDDPPPTPSGTPRTSRGALAHDALQISLHLQAEQAGGLRASLGGLHLLHPTGHAWGDLQDCHSKNPNPEWDADVAHSPTLQQQSADTWLLTLNTLPHGPDLYRIGVDRTGGAGVVRATMEVRLRGKVVWVNERLLGQGQSFWDAAAVGWWSNRLVLLPIDRVVGKAGDWPDPGLPLEAEAPCLPSGPPCVAPNVCLQSKASVRWWCSAP